MIGEGRGWRGRARWLARPRPSSGKCGEADVRGGRIWMQKTAC